MGSSFMTPTVLREYIQAEMENIRETVERIETVRSASPANPSDVEVAALSVYVHNTYNGMENIFKLIRTFHGKKIQKTADWHRALLNESRDNGVINDELWTHLDELLSFRHHLVHSYVFKMDWPAIKTLVTSIRSVADEYERQVMRYLDRLPKGQ